MRPFVQAMSVAMGLVLAVLTTDVALAENTLAGANHALLSPALLPGIHAEAKQAEPKAEVTKIACKAEAQAELQTRQAGGSDSKKDGYSRDGDSGDTSYETENSIRTIWTGDLLSDNVEQR